jgi:actin-related protein 2
MDKVICDNGSGFLKMGFAGENFPRYTIPSIAGRPLLRANQKIGEIELKPLMLGDEANPLRSFLEISYPIREGIVDNWEDMEALWAYTFHTKMGLPKDLRNHKIIVTEAAMNPKKNRAKMAQILFEKFGFGGVKFEMQALLSLFAEGEMTGLVFDAGDGVSHCIPVIEGFALYDQVKRLNVAGRHITDYLIKLLLIRGYAFNSSADFETVREIKEQLCYVSYDLGKDRKLAQETTVVDKEYRLPDGQLIYVGRERFEAPECLFNPLLIDVEQSGISDLIYESICESPIDCQKGLFGNITLAGGTTMFPGLSSRVEKDIRELFIKDKLGGDRTRSSKVNIFVHDPPRRKHNVFIGASFVAKNAGDDQYQTLHAWKEQGEKLYLR